MTTTASSTPPSSGTNTTIIKDATWIWTHLLAIIITAALITTVFYLAENRIEKRAEADNAHWTQLLNQQTAQIQFLQKQADQDEQRWATIAAQLTAKNAALEQEISSRDNELKQQEVKDANLTVQQAARQLAADTKASNGDIATNGDDITMSLPLTRRVVGSLDLLATTQEDLAATKQQLSNEITIAVNAQNDVTNQKKIVSGQQVQLVDAQKVCSSRIKVLKAKRRKDVIKSVLVGIGIGLGIGIRYF